MSGLPAPVLKKLKQTLLDCGPFGSDRALLTVFSDERITPWRNSVPEAYNRRERVDLFVADFLNRRNSAGRSVLVLFLQAVYDQGIEEADCQERLNDVAIEVATALGDALPPLARDNLWRAAAASAGTPLSDALGGYALPAPAAEPGAQLASLPPALNAEVFAAQLESLKNRARADWLPVSFLEKGLQAARAVGRVEHHGRKIGTAFLVTPDLVLTNAHVMREIPALAEGGVRFHVGLQGESQWLYFSVQVTGSPVEELDFALVRLAGSVETPPVQLSDEIAYEAQLANILQYPHIAGGSMQVALRHNAIVYVEPTRVYYVTDTEEGSSGSPVFSDEWRVIALHRAGIVDDAQRPMKNANQGVSITAIEPLIRSYLS